MSSTSKKHVQEAAWAVQKTQLGSTQIAMAGLEAAPKYGGGHEHMDTVDNFEKGAEHLRPNEQNWNSFRQHAGAADVNALELGGVDAAPKYGAGHEHKDTEDHFSKQAGYLMPGVGEAMPENVPRYGGGVELMDGHLIKAEDKDTFAHLEYGTLLVKHEYDTSQTFKYKGGENAKTDMPAKATSIGSGFVPTYRGSQKTFLHKPKNTNPSLKSLDGGKAVMYGGLFRPRRGAPPRSDVARDSIAGAIAKRRSLDAARGPKRADFDMHRHLQKHRADPRRRTVSPGPGGEKLPALRASQSAGVAKSVSTPNVRSPRSRNSPRAGVPKSASAPEIKNPSSRPSTRNLGPESTTDQLGLSEMRRIDEMKLAAGTKGVLQYGEQHKNKDTESFLEAGRGGLVPTAAKSIMTIAAPYGAGHEDLDTFSHFDANMVPVVGSSSDAQSHVTKGAYGAGHEDLDTFSHFGAGMVPVEHSSLEGGVSEDRVFLQAPKYGGGHEDLDTKDNFDKSAGFLVPNKGADSAADMRQGQHYTEEHLNKDTFSHFGSDMVPRAEKGTDSYGDAVDSGPRVRRVPKKTTVTYPGNVRLTNVENFGVKATRTGYRGFLDPYDARYQRYDATAEEAASSNTAAMVFPGYYPVKPDNMCAKILDPSKRIVVRKSMVDTQVSKDVGAKQTYIKSTFVQAHYEVRPGSVPTHEDAESRAL